jgi:hypothetical protein
MPSVGLEKFAHTQTPTHIYAHILTPTHFTGQATANGSKPEPAPDSDSNPNPDPEPDPARLDMLTSAPIQHACAFSAAQCALVDAAFDTVLVIHARHRDDPTSVSPAARSEDWTSRVRLFPEETALRLAYSVGARAAATAPPWVLRWRLLSSETRGLGRLLQEPRLMLNWQRWYCYPELCTSPSTSVKWDTGSHWMGGWCACLYTGRTLEVSRKSGICTRRVHGTVAVEEGAGTQLGKVVCVSPSSAGVAQG